VYQLRLGLLFILFLFFKKQSLAFGNDSIQVLYHLLDTSSRSLQVVNLKRGFASKESCADYLKQLPLDLQKQGYLSASVDSISWGATKAQVWIFIGSQYWWAGLERSLQDQVLLERAGFTIHSFDRVLFDPAFIRKFQDKLLNSLEESGYPFAAVGLDSVRMNNGKIRAMLKVEKGPLYKIDSIRIFGDATIKSSFLRRYLDLPEGMIYQRSKLEQISSKLKLLPYIQEEQPWNLNLLGGGSVLDLYLKNKRSSQINGLLGVLPSNNSFGGNRLVITGDLNIQLKNGFGQGESLMFLFQQIQARSPRLQLAFQQPYIAGSAFGIDLGFDGFRKDSSFLNIRLQAGVQYAFGVRKTGKVFFQQFITTLDIIDTGLVRQTRRLPPQLDQRTTSIGLDIEWGNTGGLLNPRNGYRMVLNGMAGIRRIRPNGAITSIKNPLDPLFNYASLYDSVRLRDYSFRLQASAARYFPTGRQTVLKTALMAGLVESRRVFRNELFQIGGFQLLRGFNDQSIFASMYCVGTFEYRLLTGQNSFLYAFTDGGLVQNKTETSKVKNFFGSGIGTVFDTKAGLFNLAFALGAGGGSEFSFRQAKIHFGYINQF
jgi:outer membrane protein assembly factor BamA